MKIPLDIKIGWFLVGVNVALAIITGLESKPGLCIMHVAVVVPLIEALIHTERRRE